MINSSFTLKSTLTFFTILLATTFGCAQQLISGTITGEENGTPLAYASVILQAERQGVLSDEDGFFEIEVGKKGDSLIVQYVGYDSKTIAIKNLQKNGVIRLTQSENVIEEVVVSPIKADSIMKLMRDRFEENHIRPNSKQNGFTRSQFSNNGNLFQIAESSYQVLYDQDDSGSKRVIKPLKSRMVIDSAAYSEMNEIFNFKKDTFVVDPLRFVGVSQTFDSERESSNESKKWTEEFEYLGKVDVGDRVAYEIKEKAYRKKDHLLTGIHLIDVETYALLSTRYETLNEDELNKLVPFYAKIALGILGYKFKLNKVGGNIYYRYNGEFFELDKGGFELHADVARSGDWITGSINQDFYLQAVKPSNETPKKRYNVDTEIVSAFQPEYFAGLFHLTTTSKTHEKINVIQQKNADFSGEIYSQKHEKWLKKQERKKNK